MISLAIYKLSVIVSVSKESEHLVDFLKNEGFDAFIFDNFRNRFYHTDEINQEGYSRWLEYHFAKNTDKRPSSALFDVLENDPTVKQFLIVRE